jgi:hypothetical protein
LHELQLQCRGSFFCITRPLRGHSLTERRVQDRLNLLLAVSGASALSLTLGFAPEQQTLAAALSALFFNFVYDLVLSRSQQQYALVPFLDLANHCGAVSEEVAYAYFQDGFTVDAGRSFRRGEQVLISYGRQTADSLLQFYGFVDEEGGGERDAHTLVDVGAALVGTGAVDAARAREPDVAAALERVQLSAAAQVSDEAKAALRYVTRVATSLEAGRGGGATARDAAVWRALCAAVKAERVAMGSSIKDDRKAARQAENRGDERGVLIACYVAAKKAFLEARAAQLEQRAAALERQ